MNIYKNELKEAYYCLMKDMLENLDNILTKLSMDNYANSKEMRLHLVESDSKLFYFLQEKLVKVFGNDSKKCLELFYDLLRVHFEPNKEITLECYYKFCELYRNKIESLPIHDENIDGIVPTSGHQNDLVAILDENERNSYRVTFNLAGADEKSKSTDDDATFVLNGMRVWNEILTSERQPTPNELLCLYLCMHKMKINPYLNHLLFKQSCYMSTPGFRPYTQTYMSLTDPGFGHKFGTLTKLKWIKGAIVHVEHLERQKHLTKAEIESYRIPSIMDFKWTRFMVGNRAPNTFYIGRILRDSGHFENDLLRLARIFANGVNEPLSMGATECKVSMDGLSSYECVKFMRALKASVLKNPYQILSAAWNLNNPLNDDLKSDQFKSPDLFERKEKTSVRIEKIEIAKFAVLFTSLGGFEKVTWDGASDTYPSECIVPYQLSLQQALEVVHLAHSLGLVTYFSAGFKFDEIKAAVLSGVDGIGIGGAQVLRDMDHETGMHGAYKQENIDAILKRRDEAANSQLGQCVKLLARLDTMYNEGSLTAFENEQRLKLFTLLSDRYAYMKKNIKEYENLMHEVSKALTEILDGLKSVLNLKDDANSSDDLNIYHRKLTRLYSTDSPLLLANVPQKDLNSLRVQLAKVVDGNCEKEAYDFYHSDPFKTILRQYRKKIFHTIIETHFKEYKLNFTYENLIAF